MPFRRIRVASLGCELSNVMACPSSAEPASHQAGLDRFRQLGGNCLHLHGEGGETHSRRAVGEWLQQRCLRSEFFICAQICHEGWDALAQRAVDRVTPSDVSADISAELALLQTAWLDLVYIANPPTSALESALDAVADEIRRGRVRTFGVRNWTPAAIESANAYLLRRGAPGITTVVTTELALLKAAYPLWPQDIPFGDLETTVRRLGLAVFVHADAFNVGEQLFTRRAARVHSRWRKRWESQGNRDLVTALEEFAARHDLTAVEANLVWLFGRPFPTVALISLPDLLTDRCAHLERSSSNVTSMADLLLPSP